MPATKSAKSIAVAFSVLTEGEIVTREGVNDAEIADKLVKNEAFGREGADVVKAFGYDVVHAERADQTRLFFGGAYISALFGQIINGPHTALYAVLSGIFNRLFNNGAMPEVHSVKISESRRQGNGRGVCTCV
jgi:hypothetical protein